MKKHINLIFKVLVLCFAFFLVASCTTQNDKLGTKQGVTIEGGKFANGAEMVVDKILTTNNAYSVVVNSLTGQKYDQTSELTIYDISVFKDGMKVQPNGKAKVTVPVPDQNHSNYVVFHILDDGKVEVLDASVKDGMITFETTSFSYFAIAKALDSAERKSSLNIRLISSFGGSIDVFKDDRLMYSIPSNNIIYIPEGDVLTLKTTFLESFLQLQNLSVKWVVNNEFVSYDLSYELTMPAHDLSIDCYVERMPRASFNLETIPNNNDIEVRCLHDKVLHSENCNGMHYIGQKVRLEVAYYDGYRFKGWFKHSPEAQDLIPISTELTIDYRILLEEEIIYALFEDILSLELVNEGVGSTQIVGNSNFIDDVKEGEKFTFEATYEGDVSFHGWFIQEGNVRTLLSKDNPYVFTMPNKDVVVVGVVKKNTYSLSVHAEELVNPFGVSAEGHVSAPEGGYFGFGEEINVSASEEYGSVFRGWFNRSDFAENGLENATPLTLNRKYSFTMPKEAVNIVAVFEKMGPFRVILDATPSILNDKISYEVLDSEMKDYLFTGDEIRVVAKEVPGFVCAGLYYVDAETNEILNQVGKDRIEMIRIEESDVIIRAVYVATTEFNISHEGPGSTTISGGIKSGDIVAPGTEITLTYTQEGDTSFNGWYKVSGSTRVLLSKDNPFVYTMPSENATLVSVAKTNKYALNVTTKGLFNDFGLVGAGFVQKPTETTFEYGVEITLIANREIGSSFKGWYKAEDAEAHLIDSATPISTNYQYEFTMPKEAVNIVAVFEKMGPFRVILDATPSILNDKISYEVLGSEMKDYLFTGDEIRVVAKEVPGFVCAGLYYVDAETNEILNQVGKDRIEMIRIEESDVIIRAVYEATTTFTLIHEGPGAVEISGGIKSGDIVYAGTSITVKLSNDDHVVFQGWRKGSNFVSFEKEYTFTMPEDSLTLECVTSDRLYQFAIVQYQVSENGTWRFLPIPQQGFKYGDLVTAIATPYDGYRFVGWYENIGTDTPLIDYENPLSTSTSYTFNMPGKDYSICPVFETIPVHFVNVSADPETLEAVSVNDTPYSFSQEAEVQDGFQATIYALNMEGYKFLGWYERYFDQNQNVITSSTPFSLETSYTFMPDRSYDLVAKYELLPTLTINAEGRIIPLINGYESFSSSSIPFEEGTQVNLYIKEVAGYKFLGWYEVEYLVTGEEVVKETPVSLNKAYSFAMPTENYKLVAKSEMTNDQTYDLEVLTEKGKLFIENYEIKANQTNFPTFDADAFANSVYNLKVEEIYGYEFLGWFKVSTDSSVEPSLLSANLEYAHTITENIQIVAKYQALPMVYLTVVSYGPSEAIVNVNDIEDGVKLSVAVVKDQTSKVVATAVDGYTFLGWYSQTISDVVVNETLLTTELEYSFVATDDMFLIAKYEEVQG